LSSAPSSSSCLTDRDALDCTLQLNPTVDVFGEREYVHPLLGPESHLMATAVQLTDVAIDPELLIEDMNANEGGGGGSKEKGKEKDNNNVEDVQELLEIDVVQGLVDDLAQLEKNRTPLAPLLEDLTTTRDRLCAMLAGIAGDVEPLLFHRPPPPRSSSSSSSSS
jgi:hypothetical protein